MKKTTTENKLAVKKSCDHSLMLAALRLNYGTGKIVEK